MKIKLKRYLPLLVIPLSILIAGMCFYFSFTLLVGVPEAEAQEPPTPLEQLQAYLEDLHEWLDEAHADYYQGRMSKAAPDECFYGIGDGDNYFDPTGIDIEACLLDEGQPKVNQAYVWGLAKAEETLWFGTAANVHCLVMGGYLGSTSPVLTDSYVCEFGDSDFSPPLPASIGDARPTRIYTYNTETEVLEDKTPLDPLALQALGIRSAGALDDVVLLGGPGAGGVILFAYNSETGAYLGSHVLEDADNIRKWLVVNGILYTAIGTSEGGEVLRWTGDSGDPFQFETVGLLDTEGAELAYHEGRIFVSTWPSLGEGVAGLWMSPTVPGGGLTSSHAESWEKVWEVTDYEPDPVTAATYGGGALASFDGYLYWGTMHVPMMSTLAHFYVYGPPGSPEEALLAFMGTYRAITIFRGQDFASDPDVDLVYGMPQLPVYVPGPGWMLMDNNMGGSWPISGPSGFGNPFNNYTWTMDVFDDQLFVGTMDWSYLILGEWLEEFPPELPFDCESSFPPEVCAVVEGGYDIFVSLFEPQDFYGADLFRFPTSGFPAIPESLDGVVNYSSYGIRTMIADDANHALYLGMANPMNLLTDPFDDKPEGGWELDCLDTSDIDNDDHGDCYDTCEFYYNPDQNPDICPDMPEGYVGYGEEWGIVIYTPGWEPVIGLPFDTDASGLTFDHTRDPRGAVVADGVVMPVEETKTFYVPIVMETGMVCVVDEPGVEIEELGFASNCGGVTFDCPGAENGFTCTVEDGYYKVEGLHHSGAAETSLGGGLALVAPSNISIVINDDDPVTTSPNVTLTLGATDASDMMISNSLDFSTSSWESYATSKAWTLTGGDGEKTVYAKFRSIEGGVSMIIWDTIMMEAGIAPTELTAEPELYGGEVEINDLVKGPNHSAVYFVGNDGKRHAFPNEPVYFSYYADFSQVKVISNASLAAIPLDGNVTMRPGTWLIKIQSVDKVYAVEPGGVIRWITTQEVADELYGAWTGIVIDISDAFWLDYTEGADITSADYPTASVIQYAGETTNYYIDSGSKRMIPASVFTANQLKDEFVVKGVSSSMSYPDGADLGVMSIADIMFP